jgi:hypothetical protein
MRNHSRKEHEPVKSLPFRIDCNWKTEPWTFGGFSAEEIAGLIQIIGFELGITPQQAGKIRIHLGDHVGVLLDGRPFITSAFCAPSETIDGKIVHCDVFLNRSEELYRAKHFRLPTDTQPVQPWYNSLGTLTARLVYSWEVLVWTAAEELNHAQMNLQAGKSGRLKNWRFRYVQHLRNQGYVYDQSYSFDLVEVAAARQVLRLLEKFSPDPGRKQYFRDLYEQSLEERKCVVSRPAPELVKHCFVPTGFDPAGR